MLGLEISHDKGISQTEYLDIYDVDNQLKDDNIVYYNRDKNIINKRNALAYQEHLRWNAVMIINGYVPMPKNMLSVDVVDNKIKLYKNDVSLRLHSSITTSLGLEEYFNYMAKLILAKTNLSEIEAFNMVENKKYDYILMDNIYDDLTIMGINIKRS